ncbi:Nodulation protein D 2 [Legionella massiliensis]|uniref:Nodulation protein D 2 n=1 Tax=Legionella massiliensis TaxID=1034943 RepID=A0A078KXU6_9GAMM|nr:LysR family transcriptional regulator [Legionella massiliensis]CDZ76579.1 Nodulation protein D 2 [Legionella massiliensis]CEE12317.1 Nodulation protein D 2 [Legionella massiliensis]
MDLNRVNLNLLIHFDTLLTECSVSKAASKAHLSQTAMSAILKQLRDIFEDPLFIRESHGLKPTPKALALMPKIKTFLTHANEIFSNEEFDPSTEVATFNLILGSHGELLILSKLSAYLAQYAPNFSLKTAWVAESLDLDKLLATKVDLTIGADFLPHGNSIRKEFLLEEEMACAMRSSHPLADQELTQDLFMVSEHVNIQFIEQALVKQWVDFGFKRNIKITVSNLISALEVIRDTDYLAIVPRYLAEFLNDKQQFEIKLLPFPKKTFTINAFYHKRFDNYQPLQWLIKVIKERCL